MVCLNIYNTILFVHECKEDLVNKYQNRKIIYEENSVCNCIFYWTPCKYIQILICPSVFIYIHVVTDPRHSLRIS